jgi:beta-1,3-galactosyltransferase 1
MKKRGLVVIVACVLPTVLILNKLLKSSLTKSHHLSTDKLAPERLLQAIQHGTSTTLDRPRAPSANFSVNNETINKIVNNRLLRPMSSDQYVSRSIVEPRETCNASTVYLIAVFSRVANVDGRAVIRHTWASVGELGADSHLLFILGQPTAAFQHVEELVYDEHRRYNDVLQISSTDTPAYLTAKSLAYIDWSLRRCVQAKYIVKTDDDTYLNLPLLKQILMTYKQQMKGQVFAVGHMFKGAKPNSMRFSKWYHSAFKLSTQSFPNYLSGSAYVIDARLLEAISSAKHLLEPLWLEDVYVTGMLAVHAGAQLIHDERFHYNKVPLQRLCQYSTSVVASHGLSVAELERLWQHLHQGFLSC